MADIENQQLPHSREAEEAVVGSVLIAPELYRELSDNLAPEDFYIHRLRWFWEAYARMNDRGVSVDIVTLSEELGDMGRLEEVGGAAYITSLLNQVPTTLHAEAYAGIVKSTSARRKLLAAAADMASMAYDESLETGEVLDRADTALRKVSLEFGNKSTDAQSIEDVAAEHYERTVAASRNNNPAIPTPWDDLNLLLGGLHGSDFIIAAGRPGQGKTSWLIDVSLGAARDHGKHVVVATMEMSSTDLYGRYISQVAKIDGNRLRDGKLTVEEWTAYNEAQELLGALPIDFIDSPNLSIPELRAKLRKIDSVDRIDLIVLDYIQLMGDTRKYDNRNQELSFISRNVKQMAREFNVPFLAAAQLSRDIEKRADKEPVLSDLRDSGSLEQDADIVMFISRDETDPVNSKITRLKVAKQRNGPVGTVNLFFDGPTTSFKSARKTVVGIEMPVPYHED